jgi:hypothetical protein
MMVESQEHGTSWLRESARKRAAQHKKEFDKKSDKDANDPSVPTTLTARIDAPREAPFAAVQLALENLVNAGIYRIEYDSPSGAIPVWVPLDATRGPANDPRVVIAAVIECGPEGGKVVRRIEETTYPDAASFRAGVLKKWNHTKGESPNPAIACIQIEPLIPWGEVLDLFGAMTAAKIEPIELNLRRIEAVFPEPTFR